MGAREDYGLCDGASPPPPGRTCDIRLIVFSGRRCDLAGMEVSRTVGLRGPGGAGAYMGWRRRAWLSKDMPACGGLAVAWLVRRANAPRSGIRHARHGSLPFVMVVRSGDGSSDDRSRPA